MVECEFHYAGCEAQLPHRSMPDHLKDGLFTHVSQLAMSHKRQGDEMKAEIKDRLVMHFSLLAMNHKRQEDEIKALTTEIKALNTRYQD